MDSLNTPIVFAAKLSILNPNEFDLWKTRIEQYFLMSDYSLWEVILNEDSPVPTIVVDGVVQPVSHRQPTKNLAFVSSSNTDSTTDSVSAATSVSAIYAKMHIDVDDLEEIDLRWQMAMLTIRARRFLQKTGRNLGDNRVTSMGFDMSKVKCYNYHRKGHFARECRSPKDSRRSGCYDWSYQAKEEPANFALMAITSSSSSLDNETNEKHSLGYFSLESDCETLSPSSLSDRSQPSGGYYVVPPSIIGTFMPPKPVLFFHTYPINVETDYLAFTVQLSPSKPTQDLSHTNRPFAPIIKDWPVEAPILDTTLNPTSPKSNSSSKRRNRKTCFVCRSVDHLIKDYDYHAKKKAQPTPRNYAHRVLTQSKPVSITAVRLVCADVPKIMVTRLRHAHSIDTKFKSPIRRHITHNPSLKTSNSPPRVTTAQAPVGNPQYALKDKGVINSGCSLHMTVNMSYLSDFKELNGGYVAFGGNLKGKISGKGTIKTCKLDFKDVYFVKELKFNLFSVSQMCEKKNRVLFTDTNGIAERKNRTFIEAARTMLADSLLPILFWAEAVNTACYDQNRVLVSKPHNKTPYELLHGRTPSIGFMRPFGCPVTILNILNPLGKFKGKIDEGFLVGYSVNSSGLTWLFDIDSLTRTMNYQPVTTGNQSNLSVGFKDKFDAEKAGEEVTQQYMLFLVWSSGSSNPHNKDGDATFDGKDREVDTKKHESAVNVSPSSSAQSGKQDDKTKKKAKGKSFVESFTGNRDLSAEFKDQSDNSSNDVNAAGSIVPTTGQNSSNSTNRFSAAEMEDITYSDHENVGAEANFNNLETSITVKQKKDGIFISQDKYVDEILKKFGLTEGKSASTPIDTKKPLLKDPDGEDVDIHIYRSMIGSLMYLTSSRPDIMFAAEYVAAASCCAQVLWIQNQLMDYRISNRVTIDQMGLIDSSQLVSEPGARDV
nr:ribonuclease H-like domain-containing protein [Tanacetum cinerariifolium]